MDLPRGHLGKQRRDNNSETNPFTVLPDENDTKKRINNDGGNQRASTLPSGTQPDRPITSKDDPYEIIPSTSPRYSALSAAARSQALGFGGASISPSKKNGYGVRARRWSPGNENEEGVNADEWVEVVPKRVRVDPHGWAMARTQNANELEIAKTQISDKSREMAEAWEESYEEVSRDEPVAAMGAKVSHVPSTTDEGFDAENWKRQKRQRQRERKKVERQAAKEPVKPIKEAEDWVKRMTGEYPKTKSESLESDDGKKTEGETDNVGEWKGWKEWLTKGLSLSKVSGV
ncbi:hypothetical protein M501DRAFT_1016038 [Patellaria atrata CBS 101060]|uniref:Uncharacterized protein n=1 Tax=Patellaria atrata CBS 101060 TaxID=1346257 RepID=A0A9P4VNN5_9PEZI|nr:hypothetical protein M501DRAFT_1016038 [Patellaria atrata CBS 101060]